MSTTPTAAYSRSGVHYLAAGSFHGAGQALDQGCSFCWDAVWRKVLRRTGQFGRELWLACWMVGKEWQRADLLEGLVRMQRHRDHWRGFADGRRDRPDDYLKPGDYV